MTVQPRQKWNEKLGNFVVGDIVLLKADASRNQWPMAKVVQVNKDSEGVFRSVQLLIGKSPNSHGERILERPVYKIVLIKESEVQFPDEKNQDTSLLPRGGPVVRTSMMEKLFKRQ